MSVNPYKVVQDFEEAVAQYCGSKYAVAVESCTSALFLSLVYMKQQYGLENGMKVSMPARSYPGVACSIIHAGFKVEFTHEEWGGEYELGSTNIWDAALMFKKGMYHGGLQCLSFHLKKVIGIGRGGMILTDNENAMKWLKKARFDGRDAVPLSQDNFTMLGWNVYLQPDQAARGMQLMQMVLSKYPDGMTLPASEQGYPNLDLYPIYKQ